MDKLGDRTWKAYYAEERERRRDELEARVRSDWEMKDDEVAAVLRKGGALSFPHTYIDSSFSPILRTVRAVHRSGKDKVLALGVVHSFDYDPDKEEFSLDGLSFMLDLVESTLGQPKIGIKKRYVVRDRSLTEPELIVKELEAKGETLKDELDDDTALLITGDLVHYGHGYGMSEVTEDPRTIDRMIRADLDLLYNKRDHLGYFLSARNNLNDQTVIGLVVSTLLGSPLEYKVFSTEMTDYSEILGTKRPTIVASVHYGVNRV